MKNIPIFIYIIIYINIEHYQRFMGRLVKIAVTLSLCNGGLSFQGACFFACFF